MIQMIRFLLSIAILLLSGCGGGTTGTDGGTEVRILGIVKDAQSNPVPDVVVTDLNNGQSAQTDEDGSFVIDSEKSVSYNLEFVLGTRSFQVQVTDNDPTRTSISIIITVDVDSGQITVEEVSVLPITTPTPQPTSPSVTPGQPTDSPTVTPTQNLRSIISGTVIDEDSTPISGAQISLSGSSVSDTSGTDGRFSLRSEIQGTSVELMVSAEGSEGSVTISGLPSTPFRLTLTIRVTQRDSVIGSGVEIVIENSDISQR